MGSGRGSHGRGVGGDEVHQQGVVYAGGVVVPVEAAEADPAVADVVPVIGLARVGDVAVFAVEDKGDASGVMARAALDIAVAVNKGHHRAQAVGQLPVLTAPVNVVKADGSVGAQITPLAVGCQFKAAVKLGCACEATIYSKKVIHLH